MSGEHFRIALTGVPGTGKTTVASALAARGVLVVHLQGFARDAGLLAEMDAARGSHLVDVDELAKRLGEAFHAVKAPMVIEGHYAHEMDVDAVVLLRVDPLVLVERLRARGWSDEKVRENVEAEALDILAAEVLDTELPAEEIDATRLPVEAIVDRLFAIAEGGPQALKRGTVGNAHWSLESLPWF